MYCRNCGKEVLDQGKFCPHCGTATAAPESAVKQPEAPQSAPSQSAPQQPVQNFAPKKSGKGAIIALIIALIVVVVFGTFIVLEATGVTEITGWFDNGYSVSENDDDEEAEVEKDEEKADEEEEEEPAVEEEPESEYSSEDAKKVAEFVETYRSTYEGSDETGTKYIKADGTTVIFGYKFSVDLPEDATTKLAENFQTPEKGQELHSLFAELQEEEPAITSITIEYRDKNDALLYSMAG